MNRQGQHQFKLRQPPASVVRQPISATPVRQSVGVKRESSPSCAALSPKALPSPSLGEIASVTTSSSTTAYASGACKFAPLTTRSTTALPSTPAFAWAAIRQTYFQGHRRHSSLSCAARPLVHRPHRGVYLHEPVVLPRQINQRQQVRKIPRGMGLSSGPHLESSGSLIGQDMVPICRHSLPTFRQLSTPNAR